MSFKKLFKHFTSEVEAFDPAILNDELALRTDWQPLVSGGTNFKTHNLIHSDIDKMEFKCSIAAKLFALVFIIMGTLVPLFIFFGDGAKQSNSWVVLLIMPVFVGVGAFMWKKFTTPIVFNQSSQLFYKGKNDLDHSTPFASIHAIQLLKEYCRGDKSSYYSYELNLVLKTGERINVIDHGHSSTVIEDAQTLSAFLGKPVWNSVS